MARPVIFVLEDDPALLTLYESFLSEEGYQVVSSKTAIGAYQQLRGAHAALAIFDVRMERPESGWELVQLLRVTPEFAHLPIIICTADARFAQTKAAELATLRCTVVIKPFALDDLLRMIRAQLAGSAAPSTPGS